MNTDNKQATLELGTKPVGQLLVSFAIPAIVAMLASSLYNICDRIFIGQVVGPMAISGLAITFPFMNLSGAFGAAVGVGASTAISIKLGQRDYETAERLLGNTVTLNLVIGLVFALVSFIFLDPILYFFGASEQTLPYARDYMEIILLGNMVNHMYMGMNSVLRSASKPRQAMYATIFTVGLNVALDAVFILWLGWGIRGAAWATVISQALALVYQLRLLSNKDELLHLRRGIYGLRMVLVKNILAIGIAPFLMNACTCIIVIFMNNQLVRYGGDLSVGAYGIANSIATVFVLFVIGLNQGMQPIAGYNYGAQQVDRLVRVLRLTVIAATAVMTVGWIFAMFLPEICARLFTSDPTLIAMAARGLRIQELVFPLVGSQIVIGNFFQCIGKVKLAIFLSVSRQMVFLLPLLGVLPLFWGIDGVWASMPISDIISVIIGVASITVYLRKLKNSISHEQQ